LDQLLLFVMRFFLMLLLDLYYNSNKYIEGDNE